MGLDVYVGPLTRYYAGTWKTIVQQMGEQTGMPIHIVRAQPEPEDKITDPGVIADTVRSWQRVLSQGLECDVDWADNGELPYWTDKPDWDGYGAVLLAAAYEACPELKPSTKRGFLSRRINPELPRRFHESPAYRAALRKQGGQFPALLLATEWWLPLTNGPRVFAAADLGGKTKRMGRVDALREELDALNRATVQLDVGQLTAANRPGPPPPDSSVEEVLPFGLSIFLMLATQAADQRQPMLLDY
jgi:hypothetical protein